MAEHPADGLAATGYLHEDRVGRADVGSCCLHLNLDKNKLHYALSRFKCADTFGVLSSDPTRCSSVIYMSLPTPSIKGTKNAARRGFVCFFCAAHLNLDVAKISRISETCKHRAHLL